MNVMRSHPTKNRGGIRTVRKGQNDVNIFQTVRVGRKGGPTFNSSSTSSQAIGSSTLSRLHWSNHQSDIHSSTGDFSVSRILSSHINDNCWNANEIVDGRGSIANCIGQVDDTGIDNLLELNNANMSTNGEFFNDILSNPNGQPQSFSSNGFHFSNKTETENQEESAGFFSLHHVLQSDSLVVEQPCKSPSVSHLTNPLNSNITSQSNAFDENHLFKTPMPFGGSDGRSKLDHDYESIFNTPIRASELPKLSTPLFSAKLETEASLTTPSRSKTKTNKSSEPFGSTDCVIVAITEGRGYALGEVGLALINLNQPVLTISQVSDCQTYSRTISQINLYNPLELIVPDTFVSEQNTSDLYKRVTERFASMKVVSLKRQFFSGEQGLEVVRSLCLPEYSSIDIITLRKYYALAAAAALIKYIEHEHNTVYAKNSIQIAYEGVKGMVALDMASARRLELVKTHGDMVCPEKYSLMGIMDSTVTLGGKRRLRSEILQPPAVKDTIEERLDAVSSLISNPSLLASLQAALMKYSDVEKLMWLCKKTPNFKQEKRTNEIMTNYILLLKNSLQNLPSLLDMLSESENDVLINIRDTFADQRFKSMMNLISTKIHDDAKPIKGYQGAEMNRCFSIKNEVNGLLDVARTTYSKLIQQVQDSLTNLAVEHNLPLKMGQSAELGFHGQYVLPKNSDIRSIQIPPIFTDVKIKGNLCHVSTDEIFSLNVRIRRAVQEIQLISNVVLFELINDLRPFIGCLYNLCENVALLDLICCLAKYSMTPNFVRPTFGDELKIEGARHPILDYIDPIKPTPNDVFASRNKNIVILTGPNLSGKTVYLLQIALLQLMAQIGSYVPAVSAEFRITNHIYVRKDGTETIENKASAFSVEVKEIMYCLNTVTDTSLIILDEICTGTNNEGGTAVAWAICEELLRHRAFTFVATHMEFLTNLEKLFVNVTNFHMEAIEGGQPGEMYRPLTYTHRLLKGVTQISNYGLRLMMTTSLPESMKNDAIRIAEELNTKRANCLTVAKVIPPEVQSAMSRVDKLETFMKDLYQLSQSEAYSLDSVQRLQRFAVDNIIIEEMKSQLLNNPGTPPSNAYDRDSTTPQFFENPSNDVNNSVDVPHNDAAQSQDICNSHIVEVDVHTKELQCSIADSESQLDSDDLSDDHIDNDDLSLACKSPEIGFLPSIASSFDNPFGSYSTANSSD